MVNTADATGQILIEVAYALPDRQTLIALKVPSNTTLQQAILLSGICQQHPEIDLDNTVVGIFSTIASLQTALKAGDRVEIYRPLQIDPKQARRQRARKN